MWTLGGRDHHPGKDLRLTIDLAARGGEWEGAAALPDMNATGLELAGITVKGEAVTFSIKGGPGDPTFKGTLSTDAKALSGDFSQGPIAGTFTLAWKGEPKIERRRRMRRGPKDLEGDWEGALDVNGNVLRLPLKLTNRWEWSDGHAHQHRPGRSADAAQRDRADGRAPEIYGARRRRVVRR